MEARLKFSFQRMVTPRMLSMLCSMPLLLGLIVATGFAISGCKTSTSDGLLVLFLGVGGMFLGIAYCQVAVERLPIVFRIDHAIAISGS